MLISKTEIEKLIPQRAPMVMIEELRESSETHAKTSLTIEASNLFVEKGLLREPGLVENIAQTAAAHVGHQCRSKNIDVPIGYIASIRNLKIAKLPEVGLVIATTVKVINQILDVTVVQGTVEQAGTFICSCEMRIFAKF